MLDSGAFSVSGLGLLKVLVEGEVFEYSGGYRRKKSGPIPMKLHRVRVPRMDFAAGRFDGRKTEVFGLKIKVHRV